MQRQLVVTLAIGILLSGLGCRSESETEAPSTQLSTSPTEPSVPAPTLTADEINEGWQLLFNGSTFDGWRGLGDAVWRGGLRSGAAACGPSRWAEHSEGVTPAAVRMETGAWR